jgi:acetoin utilization deacetylase AcuC-like enzyme
MYIDFDIHHGDAVQDAFEYTDKVMTLSFHRYDAGFYPGTGGINQSGAGKVWDLSLLSKGKNYTVNVPLRPGLCTALFVETFTRIFIPAVKAFKPLAIVLCCGADGLAGDPLAPQHEQSYVDAAPIDGWNLDVSVFGKLFEIVRRECEEVPILVLGGGGYNHINVARAWAYLTLKMSGEMDGDEEKMCGFNEIPEHKFSELYSDFSLEVPLGNRKDENLDSVGDGNTQRYVDSVVDKCLKRLARIKTLKY